MSSFDHYQSPSFRVAEVRQLFDFALAGESASIVGVSGVGKSNLFNYLLDVRTQEYYLGQDAHNYIFLRVNFHYLPDFSARSVYSLLLDQLELLEEHSDRIGLKHDHIERISQYHEKLLDAGDDLLKAQRYFRLSIRTLLHHSQRKLVFLIDQFDEVYREANPRLLANLRGLREAYKYRVVYFIFTRNLVSLLAPANKSREEFVELLALNTVGLKPYNETDALLLIKRVSTRNQLSFRQAKAEVLIKISGGHAGLLRAAFLETVRDKTLTSYVQQERIETLTEKLLKLPNVRLECDKIWDSITVEEQQALVRLAHGLPIHSSHQQACRWLQIKGLLCDTQPLQFFSILLSAYAVAKKDTFGRTIILDKPTRRVLVYNQPTEPLTALEFAIFDVLHERHDEILSRDDIILAGWPDAVDGVSDEAINQVIRRLRNKIEPTPKEPRFIENVRGQGYRLNVSNPAN